MWIKRDFEDTLPLFPEWVQVVVGPRQCGKSSVLSRLSRDWAEVTLDDHAQRELAQSDPKLFLAQFGPRPVLIDEAQYAPGLFPEIKLRVDQLKKQPGTRPEAKFRLTGSNQILMDRTIKESLAGRATYFNLNTLSASELLRARPDIPPQELIFYGGWPELHANPGRDARRYLDSYIQTYVEKDIVLAAGIQKSSEFLRFVRLLAGRVSQLFDAATFARDVGVTANTTRDWLSALNRMGVVRTVEPFFSNASQRIVKAPKVYFLDTGLACRLQGWSTADPLLTSPSAGPLFESLVYAEIEKTIQNHCLSAQVHHWRSRDGEEVDFVLTLEPGRHLLIEAKLSPVPKLDLSKHRELRKVFGPELPRAIVCHLVGEEPIEQSIPIRRLGDLILEEIKKPQFR